VICGPTGVGKTETAIRAAQAIGGEIVGADSMQVYRCMDIGTAKPTAEERARIPHHMIDIVDPDTAFDAAVYSEMAGRVVHHRLAAGALPFVVGGTGLYIKALIHGLFQEISSDPAVRMELKQTALQKGSHFLYTRLCAADPWAARNIHPNDTFRIVRALEVHHITGKPLSSHHHRHGFSENRFRPLKIGLQMDRAELYDRIDRRVDAMLAGGLVEEVERLLEMGYGESLKAMQSIGYRHMIQFIRKRIPWEQAVGTLKRDTRRYAKRQLTWFRADPEVIWFPPERIDDIVHEITEFLHADPEE